MAATLSIEDELSHHPAQSLPFLAWTEALLAELAIEQDVEIGIRLTDATSMRTLNRGYRGKDKPTDVLSFAMEEGERIPGPDLPSRQLGDIILCLETIDAYTPDYPTQARGEKLIGFVYLHGLLHLLGYDHPTDQALEQMNSLCHSTLKRCYHA